MVCMKNVINVLVISYIKDYMDLERYKEIALKNSDRERIIDNNEYFCVYAMNITNSIGTERCNKCFLYIIDGISVIDLDGDRFALFKDENIRVGKNRLKEIENNSENILKIFIICFKKDYEIPKRFYSDGNLINKKTITPEPVILGETRVIENDDDYGERKSSLEIGDFDRLNSSSLGTRPTSSTGINLASMGIMSGEVDDNKIDGIIGIKSGDVSHDGIAVSIGSKDSTIENNGDTNGDGVIHLVGGKKYTNKEMKKIYLYMKKKYLKLKKKMNI